MCKIKKSIFITKNKEYLSIGSYYVGFGQLFNIQCPTPILYLNPSSSYEEVGKHIREKFNDSYFIPQKEHLSLQNKEKYDLFNKEEEKN